MHKKQVLTTVTLAVGMITGSAVTTSMSAQAATPTVAAAEWHFQGPYWSSVFCSAAMASRRGEGHPTRPASGLSCYFADEVGGYYFDWWG
jgi:hypothetical protein